MLADWGSAAARDSSASTPAMGEQRQRRNRLAAAALMEAGAWVSAEVLRETTTPGGGGSEAADAAGGEQARQSAAHALEAFWRFSGVQRPDRERVLSEIDVDSSATDAAVAMLIELHLLLWQGKGHSNKREEGEDHARDDAGGSFGLEPALSRLGRVVGELRCLRSSAVGLLLQSFIGGCGAGCIGRGALEMRGQYYTLILKRTPRRRRTWTGCAERKTAWPAVLAATRALAQLPLVASSEPSEGDRCSVPTGLVFLNGPGGGWDDFAWLRWGLWYGVGSSARPHTQRGPSSLSGGGSAGAAGLGLEYRGRGCCEVGRARAAAAGGGAGKG